MSGSLSVNLDFHAEIRHLYNWQVLIFIMYMLHALHVGLSTSSLSLRDDPHREIYLQLFYVLLMLILSFLFLFYLLRSPKFFAKDFVAQSLYLQTLNDDDDHPQNNENTILPTKCCCLSQHAWYYICCCYLSREEKTMQKISLVDITHFQQEYLNKTASYLAVQVIFDVGILLIPHVLSLLIFIGIMIARLYMYKHLWITRELLVPFFVTDCSLSQEEFESLCKKQGYLWPLSWPNLRPEYYLPVQRMGFIWQGLSYCQYFYSLMVSFWFLSLFFNYTHFFYQTNPFIHLNRLQFLQKHGNYRHDHLQTLLNMSLYEATPSTFIFLENFGCSSVQDPFTQNLSRGIWGQCDSYSFPNYPSQSWQKVMTSLSATFLGQEGYYTSQSSIGTISLTSSLPTWLQQGSTQVTRVSSDNLLTQLQNPVFSNNSKIQILIVTTPLQTTTLQTLLLQNSSFSRPFYLLSLYQKLASRHNKVGDQDSDIFQWQSSFTQNKHQQILGQGFYMFDLKTRMMNDTLDVLEQRVLSLWEKNKPLHVLWSDVNIHTSMFQALRGFLDINNLNVLQLQPECLALTFLFWSHRLRQDPPEKFWLFFLHQAQQRVDWIQQFSLQFSVNALNSYTPIFWHKNFTQVFQEKSLWNNESMVWERILLELPPLLKNLKDYESFHKENLEEIHLLHLFRNLFLVVFVLGLLWTKYFYSILTYTLLMPRSWYWRWQKQVYNSWLLLQLRRLIYWPGKYCLQHLRTFYLHTTASENTSTSTSKPLQLSLTQQTKLLVTLQQELNNEACTWSLVHLFLYFLLSILSVRLSYTLHGEASLDYSLFNMDETTSMWFLSCLLLPLLLYIASIFIRLILRFRRRRHFQKRRGNSQVRTLDFFWSYYYYLYQLGWLICALGVVWFYQAFSISLCPWIFRTLQLENRGSVTIQSLSLPLLFIGPFLDLGFFFFILCRENILSYQMRLPDIDETEVEEKESILSAKQHFNYHQIQPALHLQISKPLYFLNRLYVGKTAFLLKEYPMDHWKFKEFPTELINCYVNNFEPLQKQTLVQTRIELLADANALNFSLDHLSL